ncbi:glycerate kinase [Paeniglutamicibacter cryotolerans]|uniref:Glycerate kinase n=1 Tax=Paeniglutamicibacter cryotolerans TaxID=670079 RepID=A0A839QMX0_9MICC|nr:glycerate kinase [Paeniglutamicibacter cryotolerans]MBB2994562.1 glycerate kinase [Paeniglutamicibacter cryotolerans]
MLIVIAPDKFKGSLTGAEVARALREGIERVLPDARTVLIPVADGGEGTLAAALEAGHRESRHTVTGPTGRDLEAAIAIDGASAVIELAAASGLDLLPGGALDALGSTSLGAGQLIAAALDTGARRIVLGVGGSACTDGGAGLLRGLGARLLDLAGNPVPQGGGGLGLIHEVDLAGMDPRLELTEFVLAADVDNPLLGTNGAAAVFGPQKGAGPAEVTTLESGLEHWVSVLDVALGEGRARAAAVLPGAGAAGGAGFAALAVLGAERRRGIDVVLELTGLHAALAGAAAVITGEGSLDLQSLAGKAPVGVASVATAAGIPAHAVCGRSLLDEDQTRGAGFGQVVSLTSLEPDPVVCMADAARLVAEAGAVIARGLLEGEMMVTTNQGGISA